MLINGFEEQFARQRLGAREGCDEVGSRPVISEGDADHMLADANLVFGPQGMRLGQTLSVDECAIPAAHINDDGNICLTINLGMQAGGRLIGDDNIVVQFAANGGFARLHNVFAGLVRRRANSQDQHSLLARLGHDQDAAAIFGEEQVWTHQSVFANGLVFSEYEHRTRYPSNHFSSSGGHSSLCSARSGQLRFPLQLSTRMAYTLVRFNSWSVIGRYSRPGFMFGKYFSIRPYSARRFSSSSSSTRTVPKTIALSYWRLNSSATFEGR